MNHGSLKEQLEAAASQLSEIYPQQEEPSRATTIAKAKPSSVHQHKSASANSKPYRRDEGKIEKLKPKWLDYIHYGIELLKIYYPDCFKPAHDTAPLKKGIKQDLAKALSLRNDIVIEDKACMVRSLSYYVNTQAYLNAVKGGVTRIDLNGASCEIVTEEEAVYSETRQALKQKKLTSARGKS